MEWLHTVNLKLDYICLSWRVSDRCFGCNYEICGDAEIGGFVWTEGAILEKLKSIRRG